MKVARSHCTSPPLVPNRTDVGPSVSINCQGVTVVLGDRAVVSDVDLTVEPGSWVTVVGPNGAGKSTLLRAIAGLVEAQGNIHLGDESATALSHRDRSRLVALVPQNPVIPSGFTVADYVLLGRTPHIGRFSMEGAHDHAVVESVLEQLELGALADRLIGTLSGGERQRAVLARALAQEAPLLLLDEPSTALDVGHQQDVLDLVDSLRQSRGITVLSTMHDLTLAAQYAHSLVLLDGGRVVAAGAASDVLTEAHLQRFYRARVRIINHDGVVVVVPVRPDRDD